MVTVGSLFSGIGGFDLGLERAGMRVVWQSEIDPYASAVLRRHWPDVPNHGDIRGIRAGVVQPVDVICGGFPCQDISNAGKRAGIDGERSGLWSEYARVVGELRPRYVLVENVAALLGRGIERVLGDLAALGFDAEWHCIPASAVGAPHRRDRVWIVAYANEHARDEGRTSDAVQGIGGRDADRGRECAHVADPNGRRCEGERLTKHGNEQGASGREPDGRSARGWGNGAHVAVAEIKRNNDGRRIEREEGGGGTRINGHWLVEPDVGRVAHGVPSRVDRLRCLGNAIVPQCAEVIGRAVMSCEQA